MKDEKYYTPEEVEKKIKQKIRQNAQEMIEEIRNKDFQYV